MVSASTRIRTAEDTEDPPLARRLGTFTETLHYFRCGGVVKRFSRCWQNFLVILPSRGNRGIDPGNQDLYRKDPAETEIRTLTAYWQRNDCSFVANRIDCDAFLSPGDLVSCPRFTPSL